MVTVDFPAWHANAKCRFAEPGSYDYPVKPLRGRALDEWKRYVIDACSDCPVVKECAADALEFPRLAVCVIRGGTCFSGDSESRSKCVEHWRKVVQTGGLG